MTPAEELRAAAQRLRDLAGAATPGPWTLHETSTLHMNGKAAYYFRQDGKPGPIIDLTCHQGDAQLIEAMHPGVALALADLLDIHAHDREIAENVAERINGEWKPPGHAEPPVDPVKLVGRTGAAALALARLVLEAKP